MATSSLVRGQQQPLQHCHIPPRSTDIQCAPTGVPPWLHFVDVPCLCLAILSITCMQGLSLCTTCMQSLCVLYHLHATSVCSERAKKLCSHARQLVRSWECVCTGLFCHRLCVPAIATLSMIRGSNLGGSQPYAQALV